MKKSNLAIGRELQPRLRNSHIVRQAVRRLMSLGSHDLKDVDTLALNSEAAIDQRLDAIVVLTALRRARAKVLGGLLASEDRLIVIETLKAIRNQGTEWAMPDLIVALRTCNDPSKRAVVAWALAAYPKESDVETALLELLAREDDPDVRDHAIESLSMFRSTRVLKTLLNMLESGSSRERFWALYSLGTLADPRATKAVTRYLHDPTVIPNFRTIGYEARWALSQIRSGKAGRRPRI